VSGYYILHEGLIGYLGDQGLQEYGYKKIDDAKAVNFKVTDGWLGITDKYWASALLPDTNAQLQARYSSNLVGTIRTYQTDYLQDAQTVPIGGTGSANARLFAGAKEASVVGINFPIGGLPGYNGQLSLNHFDLLIDWGWFYFITKPMFLALDFFYRLFSNFGISILLVTVLVKLLFFSLANKSYAGSGTCRRPTRPTCSTCSGSCTSIRRNCRCSDTISRSASGRSSWASPCGSSSSSIRRRRTRPSS
jgi:YidC/Oxa1 family membrane protein insertase